MKTCKDCLMFEDRGYCTVYMEELDPEHVTCRDYNPKVKNRLYLEDLLKPRGKVKK